MENRRSVLELTDGKTKLSDDATNIIADGLTKLLGHYDNWVTVEAKKKKRKKEKCTQERKQDRCQQFHDYRYSWLNEHENWLILF